MDLNKARTFVEVVDRGGITSAANHLRRTQQAISLQIHKLEEELGVTLFERQGPKILLTEAGERFYQEVKPLFGSIDNAVQNLKADRTKASGVIKVGVWKDQCATMLSEIINDFSQVFPLVKFDVRVGVDNELETLLINNDIDLSFQIFTGRKSLFHREPIFSHPCLPVVSKDFAKSNPLPKSIEETLDLPLVDYGGGYSLYAGWVKKNASQLLALALEKSPVVAIPDYQALQELILKGVGFGFIYPSWMQVELDSGRLIPLPIAAQPLIVGVDLVYKRKHSFGYIHEAFIEHVIQYRDKQKLQSNSSQKSL